MKIVHFCFPNTTWGGLLLAKDGISNSHLEKKKNNVIMMNIYQTARKQVHNTYLMSFITIYYAQNFWQHKKRVGIKFF